MIDKIINHLSCVLYWIAKMYWGNGIIESSTYAKSVYTSIGIVSFIVSLLLLIMCIKEDKDQMKKDFVNFGVLAMISTYFMTLFFIWCICYILVFCYPIIIILIIVALLSYLNEKTKEWAKQITEVEK